MEYLYAALAIALFGYLFVYRARYNFGTKRIIEETDRYRVETLWTEFEIPKRELVEENTTDMWSLLGHDVGWFSLRFYGMWPFGELKLLTQKSGRVIHHLIPVSIIEKRASNQAVDSMGAEAPIESP